MYEDGVSKSEIQRRTKVNYRIVVRDKITDIDGREHYEINKKETGLAQEKARQMKEAFITWLWNDPARREKNVERYNNLFNCIVGRKFDDSHQTFPGMSPSISLKPHADFTLFILFIS